MKAKVCRLICGVVLTGVLAPIFGQSPGSTSDTLKVLSFNIWARPDTDWPARRTMILDELATSRPDLIGLQEVVDQKGEIGHRAQEIADSLYKRIGYSYEHRYAFTHFSFGRWDEGIAILSRHIILDHHVLALPPGVFPRKLIGIKTLTSAGIVEFYNTHLSFGAQEPVRQAQVEAIKSHLSGQSSDSHTIARILCGDFNATPDSPPILTLTETDAEGEFFIDSWAAANPGMSGFTMPSDNPTARIDYVFLKNDAKARTTSARRILDQPNENQIYASDHIGVMGAFVTTIPKLNLILESPAAGEVVDGMTPISWSIEPVAEAVEVMLFSSSDGGRSWQPIWNGPASENTYLWDTQPVPDGTRFLIRIAAVGDSSFGMSQTAGTFTVDNPGNAPPELNLISPTGGEQISGLFTVHWRAADPDGDQLLCSLDLSSNGGQTWQRLLADESARQSFDWNTTGIANSTTYTLRVLCFDGEFEVADTSRVFAIQNERSQQLPASVFQKVAGSGHATLAANVVDLSQLTGDLYRISFDDTLFDYKVYHVDNLTTGQQIVANATPLDGVTEGPLFDGIRLLIADTEQTQIDAQNTGWQSGAVSWRASVFVPTVRIGSETITGTAFPADYEITVADRIVDTSSTIFGAPATPMQFSVWNETFERRTEVLFLDFDQDLNISPNDNIFLLEPDDRGEQQLTWQVLHSFAPDDSMPIAPQPADVFVIKTFKPLTHKDAYEFRAVLTGVDQQDAALLPGEMALLPNYPNPFNPATTIRFRLSRSGKVKIAVYDLAGRVVARLAEGWYRAGLHTVQWRGTNDRGKLVSSGIYFYRIENAGGSSTRKMALVR